jgi:hypothetical protein
MNTWISSVFAMRMLDRTLFNLSRAGELRRRYSRILPEMLLP